MSSATFVNETSESFSMTLVNLKNAAMNSKSREERQSRTLQESHPVSEGKNDLNGSFENMIQMIYISICWESERHSHHLVGNHRDILDACFTARYSLMLMDQTPRITFEGDSLLLPKGFIG